MPHPQRFSGESIVSWSDLDITISVPWYLGLMFRTRKEDGVLMEATAGTSSRLHLQVSVSVNRTSTHPQSRQVLQKENQTEGRASQDAGKGYLPLTYLLLCLSYGGGREHRREIWVTPAAVPFRTANVQRSCPANGSCGVTFQRPLPFTAAMEWSM